VASEKPLQREKRSFPEPIFQKRLDSIVRTAGSKTADRGKGLSHYLIELDDSDSDSFHIWLRKIILLPRTEELNGYPWQRVYTS
jgi:hypothetical protein